MSSETVYFHSQNLTAISRALTGDNYPRSNRRKRTNQGFRDGSDKESKNRGAEKGQVRRHSGNSNVRDEKDEKDESDEIILGMSNHHPKTRRTRLPKYSTSASSEYIDDIRPYNPLLNSRRPTMKKRNHTYLPGCPDIPVIKDIDEKGTASTDWTDESYDSYDSSESYTWFEVHQSVSDDQMEETSEDFEDLLRDSQSSTTSDQSSDNVLDKYVVKNPSKYTLHK